VHVEGRVLTDAGQPIDGVRIITERPTGVIDPKAEPITTTDAGGNFKFDIAPGNHILAIVKDGYGQLLRGLNLPAGQKPELLIYRLVPTTEVSGRVFNRDGDPIAKTRVTPLTYTYTRGVRTLTSKGNPVQANDSGEYRLASATPGRYYLRAEPGAPSCATCVATYYPSAIEPPAAVAVDVAPGSARSGIDIQQRIEPVFRIRGKLVDPSGQPIANTTLSILPEVPIDTGAAGLASPNRTAADGSFEFQGVLPGRYFIRVVRTYPPTGPVWSARQEVFITRSDIDDLEIRANEGWALTGSVAMKNDAPLPEARPGPALIPGVTLSGQRVALADAEQPVTTGGLTASVEDKGAFRMEHIPPGKFYVRVPGMPENTYIESVLAGGVDITRTPLDMTLGGLDNVRVVLGSKPGEVAIRVRNSKGEAIPRVTVALWPDRADNGNATSGVRIAAADENGLVRFRTLRPEKYYAAAFEEVEQVFVRSPEFLNLVKARGVELEVTESASLDRSVEPVTTREIAAAIQKIP
jgi:protocatechuate 3,4-dioxygenase beta subunit